MLEFDKGVCQGAEVTIEGGGPGSEDIAVGRGDNSLYFRLDKPGAVQKKEIFNLGKDGCSLDGTVIPSGKSTKFKMESATIRVTGTGEDRMVWYAISKL